jgi:hypothetical protein
MRTANPALSAKSFTGVGRAVDTARAMTINGTVNKTALLAVLTLIPATYTWRMYYTAWEPSAVMPWSHRRLCCCIDYDLQETMGSLYSPDLCAP